MTRTLAVLGVVGAWCLLGASCGHPGGMNPPGGDGGDGGDAGDVPGDHGPDTCTIADDCTGALLCDPETNMCIEAIECDAHEDCGDGAYCADSGECARGDAGTPCDDEAQCPRDYECIGGFCGCDGQAVEGERVPTNMVIVLDRSGSMQCHTDGTNNNVGPDDPDSRWQNALGAIENLIADYDSAINFGLVVYPNPEAMGPSGSAACVGIPPCSDCDPPATVVDVAALAGTDIITALRSGDVDPGGCTPSGPALQAQVGYDGLADPDANNFVLFITDGAQACTSVTQVDGITALRAQDPEVKTFVVGFTEQVNPDELNDAAEAGGMARAGDTKYYPASESETLAAAFDEIASLSLSCSYVLDTEPPDLDDLYVYADEEAVPRDTNQEEGWDYDADTNRIDLYGSVCDALLAGDLTEISIVYGCPFIIE